MSYSLEFNTTWSDFDPNRHMRHSAYNDYAAEVRVRYFAYAGHPLDEIAKDNIGPVLFSEYTTFRKEIHLGEKISADAILLGLSEDKRKWKIRHQIFNEKGELSAVVDVFGAWLDLQKRKLTILPEKYDALFHKMEKAQNFEVI